MRSWLRRLLRREEKWTFESLSPTFLTLLNRAKVLNYDPVSSQRSALVRLEVSEAGDGYAPGFYVVSWNFHRADQPIATKIGDL